MPVIEPEFTSSPSIFSLSGARCQAAVLAIASSISRRWASAVLVICSSLRSLRPFPASFFLACFHSRKLMAGKLRGRARASKNRPSGCWTNILETSLGSNLTRSSPFVRPTRPDSVLDQ